MKMIYTMGLTNLLLAVILCNTFQLRGYSHVYALLLTMIVIAIWFFVVRFDNE